MATQTKSAGAFANGDIWTVGMNEFQDMANMASSDNSYSTVSRAPLTNAYTYTALCTEFGFTIPAGSLITKIEVFIEAKRDRVLDGNRPRLDWTTLLYSGGTSLSIAMGFTDNDYTPAAPLTESDVVYQVAPYYNGSPNLWGMNWTPDMINDEDFGVGFDCYLVEDGTVSVDHVYITVTYEEGEADGGVCDHLPCGKGFESMADAIKSALAKYVNTNCGGLKITGNVVNCEDLTPLVGCGEKYTLEQAFKAALKDDGCGDAMLNVFIVPKSSEL